MVDHVLVVVSCFSSYNTLGLVLVKSGVPLASIVFFASSIFGFWASVAIKQSPKSSIPFFLQYDVYLIAVDCAFISLSFPAVSFT